MILFGRNRSMRVRMCRSRSYPREVVSAFAAICVSLCAQGCSLVDWLIESDYWEQAECNEADLASYYGNSPLGHGLIAGGDRVERPDWADYHVWGVEPGGKSLKYRVKIPSDASLPLYLILDASGSELSVPHRERFNGV